MSNSLQYHGLEPVGFLCSWDFLGKNTGVGFHFLLRLGDIFDPGIEPTSFMSPALAGGFFTTEPPRKPNKMYTIMLTWTDILGLVWNFCLLVGISQLHKILKNIYMYIYQFLLQLSQVIKCLKHLDMDMAGWHHRLDGHEFEWTPGVGDGQGGLACCNSWGCKESDTTEQLNWTKLMPCISISMYIKRWMYLLIDYIDASNFLTQ